MSPGGGGPWNGRLVAVFFLALAVVVGVLAGIVLDRTFLYRAPVARAASPAAVPRPTSGAEGTRARTTPAGHRAFGARRSHAALPGRVLAWMTDSLDLSPEQRDSIAAIVRDEQARARELTRRVQPRYRILLRRTRLRVLAVLTPEQRDRLRTLLRERRASRAGARARQAPPDSSPDR